jgi:hypothetical protein
MGSCSTVCAINVPTASGPPRGEISGSQIVFVLDPAVRQQIAGLCCAAVLTGRGHPPQMRRDRLRRVAPRASRIKSSEWMPHVSENWPALRRGQSAEFRANQSVSRPSSGARTKAN